MINEFTWNEWRGTVFWGGTEQVLCRIVELNRTSGIINIVSLGSCVCNRYYSLRKGRERLMVHTVMNAATRAVPTYRAFTRVNRVNRFARIGTGFLSTGKRTFPPCDRNLDCLLFRLDDGWLMTRRLPLLLPLRALRVWHDFVSLSSY